VCRNIGRVTALDPNRTFEFTGLARRAMLFSGAIEPSKDDQWLTARDRFRE
jgi:hypothetical protein